MMRECVLAAILILTSGVFASAAETIQSRFPHPTLPYEITLTTVSTADDAQFLVSVYDTARQAEVFKDGGAMALMFVASSHQSTTDHFLYDINFDGNAEFFLQYNVPLRYDSYLVYVFDAGAVKRVGFDFSSVNFNWSDRTFTTRLATGVDSYLEMVQTYLNGEIRTISSREVTVTRE